MDEETVIKQKEQNVSKYSIYVLDIELLQYKSTFLFENFHNKM